MEIYRAACLITLLASSLFVACNNKNTQQASVKGVTGRFINQTFLDQVPDSIAAIIQGYCYEMNFLGPDSVAINYGYEQATLAYKGEGDKYELISAIQGRNLPFSLDEDSILTVMDSVWMKRDTTWVGNPLHSKFKRVPDIKEQQWVFKQYLNKRSIVGTYQLWKRGKLFGREVVFTEDGRLSGLENYTSYEICFSGDCAGEVEKPSSIISFINEEKRSVSYVFKIDKQKRVIYFYAIGQPLKDADGNQLKGGRAVMGIVFELKEA